MINLFSYDGLNKYNNLLNSDKNISEEEQRTINADLQSIVYGEKLVEFLKLVKTYINTHIHPFHGLPVIIDQTNFKYLVDKLPHEVIVQMDGVNDWVADVTTNASLLFDTSSGAGMSPSEWPALIEGRKCGYAGGLGPDNLKAELDYLDYFLPEDAVIWVDMETKLRNTQDYFDIENENNEDKVIVV